MSTYKGLIRFINETEELALVEETPLVQNVAITSTGLTSTGSGTWEATSPYYFYWKKDIYFYWCRIY